MRSKAKTIPGKWAISSFRMPSSLFLCSFWDWEKGEEDLHNFLAVSRIRAEL